MRSEVYECSRIILTDCVNDMISECEQQVAEKIVNQSRGRLSWLNCQLSSAR